MIDSILKSIQPITSMIEMYYDNKYMFFVAIGVIALFTGGLLWVILKLFGVL